METEYIYLILFTLISAMIAIVLVMLSLIFVERNEEVEKLTAYECGFHPFQDTRIKFDVRFYLVAILFIIFDLEITFLFPWVLCVGDFEGVGFVVMMLFLGMLTVGFVYEWERGALEW
jgi:NADH-quinone oxidoreductase subunit A